MIELDVLAARFRSFASTSTSRAPLYRQLSERIAGDSDVLAVLRAAPAEQALPVLLFASVHDLLLARGPAHDELSEWYATMSSTPRTDDAYPAFQRFVKRNEPDLRRLVAVRHTQTNEVGRSALLLPALGSIERETGAPLSLVEVGASAGLNLLIDRYEYFYPPGDRVGGPSPVALECATRGAVPVPETMPVIAAAVGLDSHVVDLSDAEDVRWLTACVWPDQIDRYRRLVAALELARDASPVVHRGDAVDDLEAVVHTARAAGHPVVVTSWVMSYLTAERQQGFVDLLDALARDDDISWVSLESPLSTPGLPIPARHPGEDLTVLAVTRWRQGRRSVNRLATCHPHGYWMHWESSDD